MSSASHLDQFSMDDFNGLVRMLEEDDIGAWTPVSSKKGLSLYTRSDEEGRFWTKGVMVDCDSSSEDVFDLFAATELRQKINPKFTNNKSLEKHPNGDVSFFLIKVFFPIADREVLQARRWIFFNGQDPSSGWVAGIMSITLDDIPGKVRAHMEMARKVEIQENGMLKMSSIGFYNFGGYIPQRAVNMLLKRVMSAIFDSLPSHIKLLHKERARQGITKESKPNTFLKRKVQPILTPESDEEVETEEMRIERLKCEEEEKIEIQKVMNGILDKVEERARIDNIQKLLDDDVQNISLDSLESGIEIIGDESPKQKERSLPRVKSDPVMEILVDEDGDEFHEIEIESFPELTEPRREKRNSGVKVVVNEMIDKRKVLRDWRNWETFDNISFVPGLFVASDFL